MNNFIKHKERGADQARSKSEKSKALFLHLQDVSEFQKEKPDSIILGEGEVIFRKRMRLYYICQELIRHDFKEPFQVITKSRRLTIRMNDLGKEILQFLDETEQRTLFNENNKFTCQIVCPEISLISKIAELALSPNGGELSGHGNVKPLRFSPADYTYLNAEELIGATQELKNLIKLMRIALLSNGMNESVKNFRRNATERYKHAMAAAKQAWIRNSKNILIRLDWGFHQSIPSTRVRFKSQKDFELQLNQVVACRKKMLQHLREKFKKNLAFFAWKIECGDIKGLHVHWLLAINGSHHQDRINVARQIAEEWDGSISDERSYTFNVNGLKGAAWCDLRVIHFTDPDLENILGRHCDYLTKVDYIMKLRMPKGMRSFGCSKIVETGKLKPGPKRAIAVQFGSALAFRGPQGRSKRKTYEGVI